MQQDLFETDNNIQLDDSPVDFKKTTNSGTTKKCETKNLT